jgi:hypothetical protein
MKTLKLKTDCYDVYKVYPSDLDNLFELMMQLEEAIEYEWDEKERLYLEKQLLMLKNNLPVTVYELNDEYET